MQKVGYIGLGIMGKPMARNILKVGFPLVIYNRSKAVVEELAKEGAVPANSPAEVAKKVDIIFTNLPDSPDVEMIGKKITHVGGNGAGQIAKAANQIMVGAQMVAMAELLILAKKAGADPKKVIEAIQGGAAQCWALDNKPARLFAANRQPGFKSYMQAKDLHIVMDTAKEYGIPLPATAIITQLFDAMQQMGMQNLDNSAVIGVIENLAGEKLL